MNALDFLIIITMITLLYKYYYLSDKNSDNLDNKQPQLKINKKNEDNNNENFSIDLDEEYQDYPKKNIYDDSTKYIDQIIKSKKKPDIINPYFIEIQFHNDYRDTHNAFVLLVPNQKQLFNRSNAAIINVSTPSYKEISPLIKNFINETNKILRKNVPNNFIARDWKTGLAEPEFKSGWEKQQEKLGLPKSIYNPPAIKEDIKLINIDHSERMETEDEIKYVVFLVVQKPSVQDQMLIKVSFQIDKQDINIDRNFFKKKKEHETLVKIEEVFVMGYMTKHSFGKHSIKNEYYNFDGITNGRIFSQKQIIEQLNKKRKQYELECLN
jgi:hypothetical protein